MRGVRRAVHGPAGRVQQSVVPGATGDSVARAGDTRCGNVPREDVGGGGETGLLGGGGGGRFCSREGGAGQGEVGGYPQAWVGPLVGVAWEGAPPVPALLDWQRTSRSAVPFGWAAPPSPAALAGAEHVGACLFAVFPSLRASRGGRQEQTGAPQATSHSQSAKRTDARVHFSPGSLRPPLRRSHFHPSPTDPVNRDMRGLLPPSPGGVGAPPLLRSA